MCFYGGNIINQSLSILTEVLFLFFPCKFLSKIIPIPIPSHAIAFICLFFIFTKSLSERGYPS